MRPLGVQIGAPRTSAPSVAGARKIVFLGEWAAGEQDSGVCIIVPTRHAELVVAKSLDLLLKPPFSMLEHLAYIVGLNIPVVTYAAWVRATARPQNLKPADVICRLSLKKKRQ